MKINISKNNTRQHPILMKNMELGKTYVLVSTTDSDNPWLFIRVDRELA